MNFPFHSRDFESSPTKHLYLSYYKSGPYAINKIGENRGSVKKFRTPDHEVHIRPTIIMQAWKSTRMQAILMLLARWLETIGLVLYLLTL